MRLDPLIPIRINAFIKLTGFKSVIENGETYFKVKVGIGKYHPLYFIYLQGYTIRHMWRLTLRTIRGI